MHQSSLSSLGAVVSAIIASLCCIGPVAVALLGVGSIGAFSVFEAYRPYLIGVTGVILGLAFYLTYRKREVKCEDGSCKVESAGKWNKITVWVAALLTVLALAFPSFNLTDTAGARALSQQAGQSPHAVAVLHVEGMDCAACAKGLEATLRRIEGVTTAAVDFEQRKAVVQYDPAKVKIQQLIASVDETGFTATLHDDKTKESSRQQAPDNE